MHQLVIPATLIVVVAAWALPAAADCAGPTVDHDSGEVARGDVIRITGTGFGDNCYDTGPPPPGEGGLGNPLEDILISIEQEGRSVVVAEGRADSGYGFSVEVVIPAELEPGPASVSVTWGAGAGAPFMESGELIITDAPAPTGALEVVAFGPPGIEPRAPGGLPEQPDSSDMPWSAWLPLGTLALVAAAIWVGFVWSGRRPTRR